MKPGVKINGKTVVQSGFKETPNYISGDSDFYSGVANSALTDVASAGDKYLHDVMEYFKSQVNAYSTSALDIQRAEAQAVRDYNERMAKWSSAENERMAKEVREFQAAREDTAYQRLVSDLRNAGLSPLLAYSSASPTTSSYASSHANSASGVQANVSAAKNADLLDWDEMIPILVLPLISSAISVLDKISNDGIHLF